MGALIETPLMGEDRAAGAKMGEYAGCVLPASFAGFETEYRAAREAVAIFDTNWRATIAFLGPDRSRYLNAVLTNNIQALTVGRGCLALMLNAQGHILAELEVYAEADRLLTRSHASVRERTAAALDKYIIMDDVQMEDLTGEMGSFAIEGPRAAAIVQQACGVAIEELPDFSIRETEIERIACWALKKQHFGEPGAELIAKRELLPLLWRKMCVGVEARGGAPIGMEALNSLRLEAGVPWFPVDFDDKVIPHEAALENSHISFTKGCYTGQEIVERVRSRGQVHRRRVRLKFPSLTASAPPVGTKLIAAGAEVGVVTSAALSPATGSAIGMGYIRGERNAPGSEVEFDGAKAQVM